MDTLFAILLGLIGVALLAGGAVLLWPALRPGPPLAPPAALTPDLPADDAEARERRLAELRQRRLEGTGEPYDFPLHLNEGPEVEAHRLNDDHLIITPPPPALYGEVVPVGEELPDTAERRISGPVVDNADWIAMQDDLIIPRRRPGALLLTALLGTLILAVIIALILWLVNIQPGSKTPLAGTAVLVVADFGEGPNAGSSAAGKRIADTLRTELAQATQGSAEITVHGTGRISDAAAAERTLAGSGSHAQVWGTLPQGETGTLSATLLLRTIAPGAAWERMGAAGRLLLPPTIPLPDQELVVSKGLEPLLRAVLYYQSGNFEVARDTAATLSDNANPAIRCAAGFVNANALTALNRPGEAVSLYAALDAGGWSVPAVLNNWGVAADRLGKPDEARAAFDRALAANPPPAPPARARILTNRGLAILAATHDRAAARADFQAALNSDPHQADAARELGFLAYEEADVANARAFTQAALTANPTDPVTIRQTGLVALLEGSTGAALTAFQQALTIYDGWIATLHATEGAALSRGDNLTALQATEHIRQINAEQGTTQYYRGLAFAEQARHESPPNALDRFLRNIHLKPPGPYEQARTAFDDAIRLDQDRADVRFQMGLLSKRLGNRADAHQQFQRAKDLDQSLPGPYEEEANLYLEENRLDLAIREYETLNQVNASYEPAYLRLGELYAQNNQPDRSRAAYEHLLAIPMETARDHYFHARALRALDRRDEALAEARASVALRADDWETQLLLGQLEQEAGHNTEALAAYQQVLALNTTNADAAYEAGRILAAAGQTDAASKQWEEALKRDPNHPEAHYALAALYEQTGQRDKAIAEYTEAIRAKTRPADAYTLRGRLYEQAYNWREAESDYRDALGIDTQQLDARDGLVRALLHLYQPDEALKVAQDGRRVTPNSHRPYLELAQVYLAQGNPTDAAPALEAARAIAPNDPQVLLRLGHAAVLRNDDVSSQQYLAAALQAQPNLPEAAALLGDEHYNHDRFAAAAESYQQAIAMTPPDYPPAHAGLGRVNERQGNLKAAEGEYLKAVQIDPGYAEPHLFLGDLYAAQGQATLAAPQYQLAIQLRPHWAQAHYNLAQVYFQTGQVDLAVREFTQATRDEPNFVEAWFGLGQAWRDSDHRPEAIAAYQQAVKLNPNYAQAWLYLGYTYEADGQRANAADAYRHAQDTAPDDTIRNAAAAALARLQQ
jgi:tetratricopeptide (TPR) repeat protein